MRRSALCFGTSWRKLASIANFVLPLPHLATPSFVASDRSVNDSALEVAIPGGAGNIVRDNARLRAWLGIVPSISKLYTDLC